MTTTRRRETALDRFAKNVEGKQHDDTLYPGSKKVRKAVAPEPEANPDRWDASPSLIQVGQRQVEFFTVGALGKALGNRLPATMRKWEDRGYLPETPYRRQATASNGEFRLYTRKMIEGLILIANECGLLRGDLVHIKKTDFPQRAAELFARLKKETP